MLLAPGEAVIVGETCPDDQVKLTAPAAETVAVPFAQIIFGNGAALMVGSGLTVTVMILDVVQLVWAVPVTVYDVVIVGVTVIEELVAPVFHEIPLAASVLRTTDSPIQIGLEEALAATLHNSVISI